MHDKHLYRQRPSREKTYTHTQSSTRKHLQHTGNIVGQWIVEFVNDVPVVAWCPQLPCSSSTLKSTNSTLRNLHNRYNELCKIETMNPTKSKRRTLQNRNNELCKFENRTVKTCQNNEYTKNKLRGKAYSTVSTGTLTWRPKSISQNVMAVFVGCRTMTFPAAPCIMELNHLLKRRTHTHSYTHQKPMKTKHLPCPTHSPSALGPLRILEHIGWIYEKLDYM